MRDRQNDVKADAEHTCSGGSCVSLVSLENQIILELIF